MIIKKFIIIIIIDIDIVINEIFLKIIYNNIFFIDNLTNI